MLWFWKLYVMTDYDNGRETGKAIKWLPQYLIPKINFFLIDFYCIEKPRLKNTLHRVPS